MTTAAEEAITDAGLERGDIDGLICGHSTAMPHLMLSTVFAEHFGLQPHYAHAVQLGEATGFAMTMLAHHLAEAGVAGNASRDAAWQLRLQRVTSRHVDGLVGTMRVTL